MKKKLTLYFLCFLLIIPTLYVAPAEKEDSTYDIINKTISFSQPFFSEVTNTIYSKISVENSTSYYVEAGEPVLPIYQKVYTFPMGTNIINISYNNSGFYHKKMNSPLQICPYPVTDHSDFQSTIFSLFNLFDRSKLRKKEPVEYRCGTGILKDKRVLYLSIVIYPAQYDITKQSITWIDSVDYSIKYKLPDEQLPPKKKYETLIISPSNFSDELQPLSQLSDLNYLVNLSEIPKIGRDTQEDIKYFIKNAIEQWEISNVLLVGGYHQIPCRMVHVDDIRSVIMGEKNFISDLYYADIYDEKGSFCSWDSNNNGLYGEYKLFSHSPVDELDLYPDVHLGRLACTSENDVSTVVNKTIQYVTDKSYESSWFQHVIAIGGDTFTEDIAGISEGEKINDAIIQIMSSFSSTKLWGSNGQLKHAEDISNEMENGAGFVFFEGHAGSNSYRTHPNKGRNQWIPVEWYRTYHVNSLRNEKKLPIITINACNTCKFQVDHTSLGWSFIVNPKGGGIASIGMTCLSWIYPGVFCTQGLGGEIHQNAYKAYVDGAETFGELWSSSIIQYLNSHPWSLSVYDYKTIESWQPFGYPSLKIASATK